MRFSVPLTWGRPREGPYLVRAEDELLDFDLCSCEALGGSLFPGSSEVKFFGFPPSPWRLCFVRSAYLAASIPKSNSLPLLALSIVTPARSNAYSPGSSGLLAFAW
jgi:hypothetical protein